jgi:hypothetical protein
MAAFLAFLALSLLAHALRMLRLMQGGALLHLQLGEEIHMTGGGLDLATGG